MEYMPSFVDQLQNGISRTIASANRAAANRLKMSLGRTVYTMNDNSYDAIARLYDNRANRLER